MKDKDYKKDILNHLELYLDTLTKESDKNKYLLSWILYFIKSNGFEKEIKFKHKYSDPILQSINANRGRLFKDCTDFKLFKGCRTISKNITMYKHLDIFDPPKDLEE